MRTAGEAGAENLIGNSMRTNSIPAALAVVFLAAPAAANDSVAELGAGGIMLARTDDIALVREELYISADLVSVDYVFANRTDADLHTVVAFPMPDISMGFDTVPPVASPESDNFMNFSVVHNGATITPMLDQRARALGVDVTDEMRSQNVPLVPLSDAAIAGLEALPDDLAADWADRGIIAVEEWDEGSGMEAHPMPRWELSSTYWWESTFPAGREISVSHRYTPAVGASAGVFFLNPDGSRNEVFDAYAEKYCIDKSFERAVARKLKEGAYYTEKRIEYVLTSGGNWANGMIGDYRLTIDKGAPGNLVSFCGSGVKKIAPTQFQMTARDFYPDKDIDVLILERLPQ